MLEVLPKPAASLYVHVPFCAQKCSYCAFYSHTPDGEGVNRYVRALIREMQAVVPRKAPPTIFFGGGTPSLLNLRQWEQLLDAMQSMGLLGAREWTVECNPATVSLDKARLLRSYGVNRISMGVQSFDDDLLDRLGRIHSRDMIFRSFDTLRSAGFDNVNVDLMFGIPGQTMECWQATLAEAAALQSEHLSSYEVIYEEDTPLFAQLKAGRFSVDEDLACAMFEELVATAARHGFHQYEIANFAKHKTTLESDYPEKACLHNINYWRGGEFYGLGPSAAGFVGGIRTKNWSNTVLYCERMERGESAIQSIDRLSQTARAGEIAGFGLRMNDGWPFEAFLRVTGFDLRTEWASEISRLVDEGYARMDSTRFQLTAKGLRFADWAAELFLKPDSDPDAASKAQASACEEMTLNR